MTKSFEESYPTITRWIEDYGWIEIGKSDYSESLIRAFDDGGLVWENLDSYRTLDDALQALEDSLASWLEENE
ncbi:MAG: hypothetical protein ACK421_04580 [Pseudanabaenaceae cyanobacterium]